jgi:hypothetical protein
LFFVLRHLASKSALFVVNVRGKEQLCNINIFSKCSINCQNVVFFISFFPFLWTSFCLLACPARRMKAFTKQLTATASSQCVV